MSKAIVKLDNKKIELIKNTIAKDLDKSQFELFISIAKSRGLDPVLNQIHALTHRDKQGRKNLTVIVGIDGFRTIAHRTGVYAGRDETKFEYDKKGAVIKATVTVHKIVQGVKCSFTATALMKEYFPTDYKKSFMWKKMPETMLEKCAECKALRMAFSYDLSGLYAPEEMHQSNMVQVTQSRDVEEKDSEFERITQKIKQLAGETNEKEGPSVVLDAEETATEKPTKEAVKNYVKEIENPKKKKAKAKKEEKVIVEEEIVTKNEAAQKIKDSFRIFNIKAEDIEKKYQKTLDNLGSEEIEELRGIYRSIAMGEATPDMFFS